MRYLMYLFIVPFIVVLGCESIPSEPNTESFNRELRLPLSAQIIYVDSIHSDTPPDEYIWVFWKYRGSCYLSGNVKSYGATMTKTDCPSDSIVGDK